MAQYCYVVVLISQHRLHSSVSDQNTPIIGFAFGMGRGGKKSEHLLAGYRTPQLTEIFPEIRKIVLLCIS